MPKGTELSKAMAAQITTLTAQRDELAEALRYADDCYIAAEVEGLDELVQDTADERLKDLLVRRLGFAFARIREALAKLEKP